LLRADPGRQVAVHPASRDEGRQRPTQATGATVVTQDLAEGRGTHQRLRLERAIQLVEEIETVVRVVFPRVLAVENYAHDWRFVPRRLRANLLQLRDEMRGGVLAVPAFVLETDQVREHIVAKETVQPMPFDFEVVGSIQELLLRIRRQSGFAQR